MNGLVFSAVCAVICIHAAYDLNESHRATSRIRRAMLLAMASASFAGMFRPAMDHDAGDIAATALVFVMAADCLIRRHWRHLYADRRDSDLIARRLGD